MTATGDVAVVACPNGKKVLSGGYIAASNSTILVQQSYPTNDALTSWTVVVKNQGASRTNFTAYAVCASVTP